MSEERHFDGGRLQRGLVAHHHMMDHADGRVSAVVVRGVPALICEVCEETYYDPDVTDAIVSILERTDVAPGEAIAIDFDRADAA